MERERGKTRGGNGENVREMEAMGDAGGRRRRGGWTSKRGAESWSAMGEWEKEERHGEGAAAAQGGWRLQPLGKNSRVRFLFRVWWVCIFLVPQVLLMPLYL